MNDTNILVAINLTYVLGALLAIFFLLAYYFARQERNNSPHPHRNS